MRSSYNRMLDDSGISINDINRLKEKALEQELLADGCINAYLSVLHAYWRRVLEREGLYGRWIEPKTFGYIFDGEPHICKIIDLKTSYYFLCCDVKFVRKNKNKQWGKTEYAQEVSAFYEALKR